VSNAAATVLKESNRSLLLAGGRSLSFEHPLIMGVLNVTPDSFSDGGNFSDPEAALRHAQRMMEQGADMIDIGGESTRPGAHPVSAEDEVSRVLPVIASLRRESAVPISIDTYHASTAAHAIEAGADIINDISALRFDGDMHAVVRSSGAAVILMHMLGTPATMQKDPLYTDCVAEIADFFGERIAYCERLGIDRNRILLDPGIGFGKRVSDNIEILTRLREFRQFGLPVMVGASRKSFIAKLHPVGTPPEKRIGGSLAAAVVAALNGADIIRVHDVGETAEALKVVAAIREYS
jgi:dihydropteroate synthase